MFRIKPKAKSRKLKVFHVFNSDLKRLSALGFQLSAQKNCRFAALNFVFTFFAKSCILRPLLMSVKLKGKRQNKLSALRFQLCAKSED
jgi:hypothetical protein